MIAGEPTNYLLSKIFKTKSKSSDCEKHFKGKFTFTIYLFHLNINSLINDEFNIVWKNIENYINKVWLLIKCLKVKSGSNLKLNKDNDF